MRNCGMNQLANTASTRIAITCTGSTRAMRPRVIIRIDPTITRRAATIATPYTTVRRRLAESVTRRISVMSLVGRPGPADCRRRLEEPPSATSNGAVRGGSGSPAGSKPGWPDYSPRSRRVSAMSLVENCRSVPSGVAGQPVIVRTGQPARRISQQRPPGSVNQRPPGPVLLPMRPRARPARRPERRACRDGGRCGRRPTNR